MIIRSRTLGPVIIFLFAVAVVGTMFTGFLRTESLTMKQFKASETGGSKANPADIRGAFTLADVEKTYGIPVADLAAAFDLKYSANPGTIKCNDLRFYMTGIEKGNGIGTDSIRFFVSLYTGFPYVPEKTTKIPRTALAVLKLRLSPESYSEAEALISVFLNEKR